MEWFKEHGKSTEEVYTPKELAKVVADAIEFIDSEVRNYHYAVGVSEHLNVDNRVGQYYTQTEGWAKGHKKVVSNVLNPINITHVEKGVLRHYLALGSATNFTNSNDGGGGIAFDKEVAGGWTLYLKLARVAGEKPGPKWYARLSKEEKEEQKMKRKAHKESKAKKDQKGAK